MCPEVGKAGNRCSKGSGSLHVNNILFYSSHEPYSQFVNFTETYQSTKVHYDFGI
jgi:hypothetical protein